MNAVNFNRIQFRKLKYEDDFSDFNCDYEDDLGCNDFIHNEISLSTHKLKAILIISSSRGIIVLLSMRC